MTTTRSIPEFAYDSQKELYAARKYFATTTGSPFDPEFEDAAISAMTVEQASAALALLKEHLEKYNSKKKRRKAKTATTGDEEERESCEQRDKETSETKGIKPSDEPGTSSAKKADGTKVPRQRVLQDPMTPMTRHPRTKKNLTPEKEQAARTKNPCADAHPVSKQAKPRARDCSRWTLQTSILAKKIPTGPMQRCISS